MSDLLPPIVLELRAKASEVTSELGKVKGEVKGLDEETSGGLSKSQKAFSGLAGAGKAITFGIAGAAAAIGAFGIEAATTGSVADAKLDTAIRNVGGSLEQLEPQIDATDSRMRALGFTNVDTNTALASLTTALHNPTEAMKDMGVAADLARLKNIPLADAANLVAKAAEGQTRPLKALGIDLPVYAGGAQNVRLAQLALANAQRAANDILQKTPDAINPASKAHLSYENALYKVQLAQSKLTSVQHSGQTIMAALTARVHGQAQAFGQTLPGQVAIAKAQLDNIGEHVGQFLIPKLTDLLKIVEGVVAWFGKHTTTAKILAGVIGGVLSIAVAAYLAEVVNARVQSVLTFARMVAGWFGVGSAAEAGAATTTAAVAEIGAAEDTLALASEEAGAAIDVGLGPIGLVLAAVGIAVALLASHWQTIWNGIKTVAEDAWNFIKSATQAAWDDVIKPVFGFIKTVAIDPIIFEMHLLETIWSAVWTGIQTALSFAWNDVIKPTFGFIKDVAIDPLIAEIHVFETVWETTWNAVRAVLSGAWNDVIHPVFGFIESAWTGIRNAASAAWNFLRDNVIGPIENGFTGLYNAIANIASRIGSIFSGFWDGLESAGATAFNWVARAWNDTVGSLNFSIPSWVPGFGGDSFGVPQIPLISGYASGGSVTDGLFLVGENGPELMNKTGSKVDVLSNAAPQTQAALTGSGSGGDSGGQVIEVHIPLMVGEQKLTEVVQRLNLRSGMRLGKSYPGYKR